MNNIITVGKHNRTFNVNWHSHKNWELIFCTSQCGTFLFENNTLHYKKNDLVIIAPNVLHSNTSLHGFENIHITIDFLPISVDEFIIITDTPTKLFSQCFNQIHYFYNNDSAKNEALFDALHNLLIQSLLSYSNQLTICPSVENIRTTIVKHFSDTLFDINLCFNSDKKYSANYLKKLFKKEIGLSPQQFLIELRINYAKKLLGNSYESDITIAQIAFKCGYEDPFYFSRVFKSNTGYSPKSYQMNTLLHQK